MEIKTVTETIPAHTVERRVYVASDGKEFDNEQYCRQHEDDLTADELLSQFEKMEISDRTLQERGFVWPGFLSYLDEDWDVRMIIPTTEEDVSVLCKMFDKPCCLPSFEQNHYYCVVVRDINDYSEWEFADVWEMENYLAMLLREKQALMAFLESGICADKTYL